MELGIDTAGRGGVALRLRPGPGGSHDGETLWVVFTHRARAVPV